MDETGVLTGMVTQSEKVIVELSHGKMKVISKASQTHAGTREWITVIQCIAADGRWLAPFIIAKGTYITKSLHTTSKRLLHHLMSMLLLLAVRMVGAIRSLACSG